jgi:hypothetical protein
LQITALKQQLAQLQKLIFGSKQERFIPINSKTSQQHIPTHPINKIEELLPQNRKL